jgi:hypothetical protein
MRIMGLILFPVILLQVFSLWASKKAEKPKDLDLRIVPRTNFTPAKQLATVEKISSERFADILNSIRNGKEPAEKVEALRLLCLAKMDKIPHKLSEQLTRGVIEDGSPEVRKAAALAIKALGDQTAINLMLALGLNENMPATVRVRAAEGLRWVDDPLVCERIVRIATMTIRFGVATKVEPPQIIYITDGGDVDNPLGVINLPIELPNLELVSAQTSVAAYAGEMLKIIAQRDVGDRMAWKNWLADWKRVRLARPEAQAEDKNIAETAYRSE